MSARAYTEHQPPYTYLYLNKEFKSKSKWWWSVFVLVARAHINKSAQHFPTLKIDFYFLYTECGGLVCLFVCLCARLTHTHTHTHTPKNE